MTGRDLLKTYQDWSTRKLPTSAYLRAVEVAKAVRAKGVKGYGVGWALLEAISRGLTVLEAQLGLLPWEHRASLRSAEAEMALRILKEEEKQAAETEEEEIEAEALALLGWKRATILKTSEKGKRVARVKRRLRNKRKKGAG